MRRVLVVTWALGTASGVLLGLFGVQLVSSRFSSARVSPLSHPEVVRALQAARSVPVAPDAELAAPAAPAAQPSAPTDSDSARPSAESTSTPAQASPASPLPRPGATAGTLVDPAAGVAAVPTTTSSSTTTTVTLAPQTTSSSTTATTEKPKSDPKKSSKSSTTTTTVKKPTTTTTTTTTSPPKQGSTSRTQTKTLRTRGGVVTATWTDDKVSARAWPESGWEMDIKRNGPDQVSVWFWKEGQPLVHVEAWANGKTQITEYRCTGRWGTSSWDCNERKVG